MANGKRSSSQGRPQIYPWDEWMDRKYWDLVEGEDFNSNINSFRVHVHKMARQYGLKVVTKTLNERTIKICFYGADESAPKP